MTQYVAVTALSVPRYDDEGKLTNKNTLVRAGTVLDEEMFTDKHEKFLKQAAERGSIRSVDPGDQPAEAPDGEGSEVNGPGVTTLGFATPTETRTTAAGDQGDQSGPRRPGKNASVEDLRAFATVKGIEFTEKDTKADLNRKFDEAEGKTAE